ncbi:MAG: hypothetical protein GWN30_01000 [Gammaproteobacteria bacterium]|nr:hypothetical protein [Gammaproteobacteria bacterium]
MPKQEIVKSLIDYRYSLYNRLRESIDSLNAEHFLEDTSYSYGSVRNHLVHIAQTDTRWMMGMQGDPTSRQFALDPADYPDKQAVKTLLDETAAKVTAWVDTLEDSELEQTPPGFGGPMWQSLLHIVNHGTDHREQVLHLLYEHGAQTFDQELITHLWNKD